MLPLSLLLQFRQSLSGIVELLVVMIAKAEEITFNHAILLAFLLKLDYFYVLLVIPLIMLAERHRRTKFMLQFCISIFGISVLNCLVFGKKSVVNHFIQWANVEDVTSNFGIQWYLLQECFPRYQNLFKWGLFKVIPVLCCIFVCKILKTLKEAW